MSLLADKSITLIVVTADMVMRADLSRRSRDKLKAFASEQRPAGSDLAMSVELAISLIDAKPSARTFVVAEDVWTGTLDLERRTITGIEGEELEQLLRFETESLSNLDPMSSELGMREVASRHPELRRFWCTAIASSEMQSVRGAVSLRGGKLAGIAHSIGLAGPARSTAWTEFYASLVAAIATGNGELPHIAIVPRSKNQERWLRSLETNFDQPLPETGWISSDAGSPEGFPSRLTPLANEETLNEWVVQAAHQLTGDAPVPLARPAAAETSTATLKQVSVAATILAICLCGLDYVVDRSSRIAIEAEIASLQEPAEEKRRLESELKTIQKQIDTTSAERQQLQTDQRAIAALTSHHDRFSQLLKLIATSRDQNLVVDQITTESDGLQLTGRTVSSDSANKLAMKLSPRAAKLGWDVQPPQLQGENKMVNGGPWQFNVKLIDIHPVRSVNEASAIAASGN